MAGDTQGEEFPSLLPVRKPLSLIPVSLKEAALDSPPFRATVVHFAEQFDAVEKWLDGYTRSTSKMAQEVQVLETLVGTFLTSSASPTHLSEAIIDHDYTLLAMQRYAEGAKEYWSHTIGGIKKTQSSVIDPIKNFIQQDIKAFKDVRKLLDITQRQYDVVLARYYSQSKTKEPSALREDAFQLHESRKAYLKASMDFCTQAPSLQAALNELLINVFSDQWLEMKDLRETSTTAFQKHGQEVERIRGWSKEMSQSDRVLKRELLLARVQIEDRASVAAQPSRVMDDYAVSTVPFLGARPPINDRQIGDSAGSKQGWLFVRILTGKPARYSWIRRWFFVKNGIFGWMSIGVKSGGVEESEKIGVLLCNIRPAFQEDRRFCFEVKTKDTTLLLQAETQNDLMDWLTVFDVAKERALDDPQSTELLGSDGNPTADAAFAINPAVAPELTAKEDVANILHGAEFEHPGLNTRYSVDVVGSKRSGSRLDTESTRDHASRLIQKLDLHRKTTAGAQLSPGSGTTVSAAPSYGVASLISASHTALPIGPGQVESPQLNKRQINRTASLSLAPSTLVQPPAPTNLSKTTVILSAERGIDLGGVDPSGGVPSSIMANQWGTTNYGHISRLERGEVQPQQQRSTIQRQLSDGNLTHRSSEPDLPPETKTPGSTSQSPPDPSEAPEALGHRKTASEAVTSSIAHRKALGAVVDFPSFYPDSLKAHDAQMRMFFPNISHQDRTVLVFRASWNPDERQDLPGRVFVTLNDLYFYSHHYGFTLVSGISLSQVTDVSITKADSHDYIYLQTEGRTEKEEPMIIVIKTFLEPVRLLQKRLKFLVSNCSAEEPVLLDQALQILINLEKSTSGDRDNAGDSEDDDASPAPVFQRRGRAGTQTLRVDHSIFGGESTPLFDGADQIKFRLPSRSVNYAPKDMTEVAAESAFDVSAKALFHIMFGDLSAMSQMLYRDRRATVVNQFPWTTTTDSRWQRRFEYATIPDVDGKQGVCVDTQTVDIANDHLCYVVTEIKSPWHLPHASDFSLISKVVITHASKSKCMLRIFITVEWRREPLFTKNLIESYALRDLRLDAQDLLSLVSDQVQKIGQDFYTKKAIQIFGNIGQSTEVAQITASDLSIATRSKRLAIRRRTLLELIAKSIRAMLWSTGSAIVMSLLAMLRSLLKLLSGQALLTLFLAISISINLISTTETARTWYRERSAVSLASHLGVRPNMALTRTIHLSDIDSLTTPSIFIPDPEPGTGTGTGTGDQTKSKCINAFRSLLSSTDHSSYSTSLTHHRLRNSRLRMANYRNDLLVAIRLVNRIEAEIVHTLYEQFLEDETRKCKTLDSVLRRSRSNESNLEHDQRLDTVLSKLTSQQKLENVKSWYDQYCITCYDDLEGVRNRSLGG